MSIKCPKCSALLTTVPDDLGMVTCSQCGARLRSKQPVKISVQGAPPAPVLPRIDPSVAAPADVDAVLARIDGQPSPDETIRPGTYRTGAPRAAVPPASLDSVFAEVREIRRVQDEILRLLRDRGVPAGPPASEPDEFPQAARPAAPSARRPVVVVIDDDAGARQDASSALARIASVKAAPDGNTGLAAIAAERPAAIVLELDLGGSMPGRDVVNLIKATMEWIDIPIVLYTRASLGPGEDAQTHGADAIVVKGAGSADRLVESVSTLLQR